MRETQQQIAASLPFDVQHEQRPILTGHGALDRWEKSQVHFHQVTSYSGPAEPLVARRMHIPEGTVQYCLTMGSVPPFFLQLSAGSLRAGCFEGVQPPFVNGVATKWLLQIQKEPGRAATNWTYGFAAARLASFYFGRLSDL